jgi:hypothetical protein
MSQLSRYRGFRKYFLLTFLPQKYFTERVRDKVYAPKKAFQPRNVTFFVARIQTCSFSVTEFYYIVSRLFVQ